MNKKKNWRDGLLAIIFIPILFVTPILLMMYFDKVWSIIYKIFIVFVIIVFIKGEVLSIKNIKIVLIVLFLGALLNMPYTYYEILRFIGVASFIVLSYNEFKKNNNSFMIIWFVSALIINPFFKLTLDRGLWNVIDVVWILLLILSIRYPKSE